ncbi:hypothetical protein BGZ70_000515 [Mortierella alpina]|uniref:Uncharacterized protein n=1 Tax=Mortierella alpina TaxID=64518 RepID=A0A9P6JF13_MORAP|nr:hypothetical protein BGZ70_000515 [Mortierella alpina]
MTVDDAVMQKLWKLTNELTAQLVFNRNATLELKQQLADLQAKTTVQGSVTIASDVSQTRSQEHADYTLRIANERLMEENSQLQEQLREYERWMEYIMAKFRLQNELTHRLQEENAILQARLVEVGAIARKAITDECYNTESIIETLEIENQGLREMLGVAADHANIMATRHSGNRVSFPSTESYMASSGSDREPQHGFEHTQDMVAREEEAALASSPEPVPNVVDKLEPVSSPNLNQIEQHAEKVGAKTEVTTLVDGVRKAKANPKGPTETASTPSKSSTNHHPNTPSSSSSNTKASNSNSNNTDANNRSSPSTSNSQSGKGNTANGVIDGKAAGTGVGTANPGSKRNSMTNNNNNKSNNNNSSSSSSTGTVAKSTAAGSTLTSSKSKKPNRKQKA